MPGISAFRSCFSPRGLARPWLSGVFALGLALFPGIARAQTTVSADAGLDRNYKPARWVPVQVTLTNQGAPARVEVRARFLVGQEGVDEYRLPPRELPSNANEVHTLYLKSPMSYTAQQIAVDLYKDGRLLNSVRPPTQMVTPGDWLVVGIGAGQSSLNVLTSAKVTLPPQAQAVNSFVMRGGQAPKINVVIAEPAKTPDRWQGLEAADMVVLGGVSERDFTPEQLAALRDYVNAGGTLVVTGGVNWNRLTTPFFAGLLPVQVTGTRGTTSLPSLAGYTGANPPSGSFGVSVSTPKPGSRVLAGDAGAPTIAVGRQGTGRVFFLAFDPSAPPFNTWGAAPDLWQALLKEPADAQAIPMLSASDSPDGMNQGYGMASGSRMATAPYAISQLDIPSFYLVALFLLSYIIVLVPLNYYFLKQRDKKEYAWLTTPIIVLVFTVGAYLIGYGFKGGRTLMVKVGVIETHSGQDAGPSLVYSGIFSPRKTTYDLQLAGGGAKPGGDGASTLLSEPTGMGAGQGMRVLGGDTQKIEDFAVDMWAMRVIKAEGVTPLGQGIEGRWTRDKEEFSGTVTNRSPYTLEDCRIVVGGKSFPIDGLAPGATAKFEGAAPRTAPGTLLPTGLLEAVQGDRDTRRIRRAALQPLCTLPTNAGRSRPVDYPMLIGWVKEPVARVMVNGNEPRESAATLMLVHLDR